MLCSKEYNDYLFNVATLGTKIVNCLDYDKLVTTYFQYMADEFWTDLNNGCNNNDYITYQSAENLTKYVKDLEKIIKNRYNFNKKIDYLNWFVGGDSEKILKLQRKLNSSGLSTKVMEDGVYGNLTEKAWVEFVEKAIINLLKLQIPYYLRIGKYVFENYNFVIGGGHYVSVHLINGVTLGYMVYLDDDYNIDVMICSSKDVVNDVEISAGVKYEASFDADTSSSMSGVSNGISFGKDLKYYNFSIGGGVSQSTDGSVTSYAGTIGNGFGNNDFSFNVSQSENKIVLHFNPVDLIKEKIKIISNGIKDKI